MGNVVAATFTATGFADLFCLPFLRRLRRDKKEIMARGRPTPKLDGLDVKNNDTTHRGHGIQQNDQSSGIDLSREGAHHSLYFQVIGQFYDLFY